MDNTFRFYEEPLDGFDEKNLNETDIEELMNEYKVEAFDPHLYSIIQEVCDNIIPFSPGFEFQYRLNSLNVYFEFSHRYIKSFFTGAEHFLNILDESNDREADFTKVAIDDMLIPDKMFLMQQHSFSIYISMYSIFESFLRAICIYYSRELGIDFILSKGKGSYIDKSIRFLNDSCNKKIILTETEWANINQIRHFRNNIVHSMSIEVLSQISNDKPMKDDLSLSYNEIKKSMVFTGQIMDKLSEKCND